jgi:hypothetical protein
MQKKLNEDFIESFSEQFAAKISDDFFAAKSFINGQEILSISPSKQVNFFVIKLLFNNWQQESQRLESPFFDYTAPEVKEAMLQFMNVLSRHIWVGRKEFEVLLRDAVRDTLFLIMAPNVYMEIEMDRRGTEALTEKTAKNILKYLKISKDQFSAYLLNNVGLDRDEIEIDDEIISEDQLFTEIAHLNEVFPITIQLLEEGEEEELESASEHEEEAILNVEAEDVFKPTVVKASESRKKVVEEKPTPVVVEAEIEASEPEDRPVEEENLAESKRNQPDDESPEMDEAVTPENETAIEESKAEEQTPEESATPKKEEKVEEDERKEPDADSQVSETIEEEAQENEEEEVEISIEVEEETVITSKWDVRATSENMNDDEEDESSDSDKPEEVITNIDPDDEDEDDDEDTLNAKFEDPTSPTSIAEAHENQVDSMMNAISLNQRFMFINELFDGDPEIFKESVTMVDDCASFDESVEKLVQNYARDFHWDMNSEEVKELLKIIFRRFR